MPFISSSFLIDEETEAWRRYTTSQYHTVSKIPNPGNSGSELYFNQKLTNTACHTVKTGPLELENMLYNIKGKNVQHRGAFCNHLVSMSYGPDGSTLGVGNALMNFTSWQRETLSIK